MASSTDQMNAAQLKKLEFELALKTRDEIIANLSEHTKLLSGLTIEPDARETIRKVNARLLARLINLPLKSDDRSRRESPGQSSEVVFELDSYFRCKIVDTLMTNHNVAALDDSSANELKSKLIVRNNNLICELVKLKSRTVTVPTDSSTSKGDHLIDQAAKASESQTTSKTQTRSSQRPKKAKRIVDTSFLQEPAEQPVTVQQSATSQAASGPKTEVAILKEELQKIRGELGKQISDQSSVIGSLEENVRDLKRKLDASKEVVDETTVTLELKDIEAVLAGAEEDTRSPFFYCGGIAWFLHARLHVASKAEYLHVGLYYDQAIERSGWHVMATFKIRLLSLNSGAYCYDVIRVSKNQEFKNPNTANGLGWINFITIDELRNYSFIQDDTIKLRVHLTITSIERFTD